MPLSTVVACRRAPGKIVQSALATTGAGYCQVKAIAGAIGWISLWEGEFGRLEEDEPVAEFVALFDRCPPVDAHQVQRPKVTLAAPLSLVVVFGFRLIRLNPRSRERFKRAVFHKFGQGDEPVGSTCLAGLDIDDKAVADLTSFEI